MTDVPVWRAALNDSSHPMYSVACDGFQERFNAGRVAQKHAERRDKILPFLYAILDTDALYAGLMCKSSAPDCISGVNL